MFVFTTVNELQHFISSHASKHRIGFVPTMGALHAGHLSLINASKHNHELTVCSIFVNPTQFNNPIDLEKYPRTLSQDLKLLAETGCDVVFTPEPEQLYGSDIQAQIYDYGEIMNSFEGAFRPGHFNGVITVVKKLFEAVKPDAAYFGSKDLQQCMVVSQLIKREFPNLKLHIMPTIREENGLAMSSRNTRLSDTEKILATGLYKAMNNAAENIKNEVDINAAINAAAYKYLNNPLFKIEYFNLINTENFNVANAIQPNCNYAIIIACWCGEVRLIDNLPLVET